jgi:hypothetical protein
LVKKGNYSWNVHGGIIAQLRAEVGGLKLRIKVLEHDDRRLSEVKELHSQSQEACGLSDDLGGLIAVVGLRGGLSARGSRMLWFEIGPTISRLLFTIITIGVRHLLCSSCHLGFPNLVASMQRSLS